MNFEQFTSSFQTALQNAQILAQEKSQPSIEAAHVFAAIMADLDGGVPALLRYTGVDLARVKAMVKQAVADLPTVASSSNPPMLSSELVGLLQRAEKHAKQYGDSYVASEMFLVALLDNDSRNPLKKQLNAMGLNEKTLMAAIESIRKGKNVDNPNAEGQR